MLQMGMDNGGGVLISNKIQIEVYLSISDATTLCSQMQPENDPLLRPFLVFKHFIPVFERQIH